MEDIVAKQPNNVLKAYRLQLIKTTRAWSQVAGFSLIRFHVGKRFFVFDVAACTARSWNLLCLIIIAQHQSETSMSQ